MVTFFMIFFSSMAAEKAQAFAKLRIRMDNAELNILSFYIRYDASSTFQSGCDGELQRVVSG